MSEPVDTQEDLDQEISQADDADIEPFAVEASDEVDIPMQSDEDQADISADGIVAGPIQQQTQPQQPQPQGRVYKENEYNAVAADLRRQRRDYEILQNRFMELVQAINAPKTDEIPEEELIPDPNADPAGHIAYKVDKLIKQQEEDKKNQELEREAQTYANEYYSARDVAAQFASQNPEAYGAAINYISTIHREEAMEQYPDKTEAEIINELGVSLMDSMVKWHKQGRNPGEMLWQMAVRRGFRYEPQQQVQQQQRQQPQPQPGKYGDGVALDIPRVPGGNRRRVSNANNAKSEIQNDQKRIAKARNVASMSGRSAGKQKGAKEYLQMDEETWAKEVKGMTFQQILADRGRR